MWFQSIILHEERCRCMGPAYARSEIENGPRSEGVCPKHQQAGTSARQPDFNSFSLCPRVAYWLEAHPYPQGSDYHRRWNHAQSEGMPPTPSWTAPKDTIDKHPLKSRAPRASSLGRSCRPSSSSRLVHVSHRQRSALSLAAARSDAHHSLPIAGCRCPQGHQG